MNNSFAAWHQYLIEKKIPMHEFMEQCSVCPARPGDQHSLVND